MLASACAPDRAAPGLDELNGLFVADPGIYVVPDRAWRREGKVGGSFRRAGTLLVQVNEVELDGLTLRYVPEGDTERFHFMASWDGSPLWRVPRAGEVESLVVEIDRARLTPGFHQLVLERVRGLDADEDRAKPRNFFSQVDVTRWVRGASEPQPIIPNGSLARFLEFGVTSLGKTRLGGSLFFGSQRHEVDVEGAAELVFDLENQSGERAVFSVAVDGHPGSRVELPARRGERMRVPIPPGRHTVTMQTEGSSRGLFLWGSPHLGRADRPPSVPVVIVTLDTTRRDVVWPHSGRPELTPNIRVFAEHATVYSNAYAVAPWTLPSHVSIFTGLYPSQHGVGVIDDARVADRLTLAESFRRAGYRTAGFAGGMLTSSDFGVAHGFSLFRDPRRHEEPGDVLTDAAIAYIEANSDQPLFLFVNYFDPHAPYWAPSEYREAHGVDELGRAIQDLPIWGALARNETGAFAGVAAGVAPTSDAGNAYLRAAYEAEVAFMDAQIGRLFEALREHDLYDRAMIVLVSDHGEFLGEGGLYDHSYRLDRELTAIPLLIKWPWQTTARIELGLVSHVDLFPTIAAAAGLDTPPVTGLSLDAAATPAVVARELVYLEEHQSRYHQLDGPSRVAAHLVGLQWLDSSEVVWPGNNRCSRRIGDRWVAVSCGHGWEGRLDELPPEMRATFELDGEYSVLDLDEDEAEKLRALGYLQ